MRNIKNRIKYSFLYKVILLFAALFSVSFSGCIGVGYESSPARGIDNANTVYIVKNSSTRPDFLYTMEDWLIAKGYQVKQIDSINNMDKYKWCLTYYGRWSWDVAIYLSDARIQAYRFGILSGESTFKVDGGGFNINPLKYNDGEYRINKMMDELFSKLPSD